MNIKMHAHNDATRCSDPFEHRFGRRIPLEVPVKLMLYGHTMAQGLMREASISGAFIETALELPMFTNLVVVLMATDKAAPGSPELAACVIRRETAGLAVEWRDMACPTLVALLERVSGIRAVNLRQDEAFTRIPCVLGAH